MHENDSVLSQIKYPERTRTSYMHVQTTVWLPPPQVVMVQQVMFYLFICFIFLTPGGFTTMVANEGLEKERAYLKPGPLGPTALATSPLKDAV